MGLINGIELSVEWALQLFTIQNILKQNPLKTPLLHRGTRPVQSYNVM